MKANRRPRERLQRALSRQTLASSVHPRAVGTVACEDAGLKDDPVMRGIAAREVRELFRQALALHCEGSLEPAAEVYQCVLALDAEAAPAWCNLGHLFLTLHKRDDALAACERAVALLPESAEAWTNYGNVLLELGRISEAIRSYRLSLQHRPGWAPAVNNLGTAMLEEGNLEGAAAFYELVLRLQPGFADARLNRGIVHLKRGEFAQGWPMYEARLDVQRTMTPRVSGGRPQWRGEALDGAVIFLYAEQGLGDAIQFLRYLPMVEAAGGRIILQLPGRLHRLARTLAVHAEIIAPGEPIPPFTWQCPLLSLPLAFATRLESIPGATPYLRVPAEEQKRAQALPWPEGRLRVGLVWAGTPDHPRDWARSLRLSQLEPLFDVEGVHFFSLQAGAAAAQLQAGTWPVVDLAPVEQEMADAAGKIMELDLVIAVDTAIAHLVGALGKPVWLLLPAVADWRWLLDREDSPWYPTMRLFRQPQRGEWAPVIARVREELMEAIRMHGGHHADKPEAPPSALQQKVAGPQAWVSSVLAPGACKVCGAPSPLFGVVDFHKSCMEAQGRRLGLSGIPVYYRRCNDCGFLFTEAFDGWTREDFAGRIYNTEYEQVDPDYLKRRPQANARLLMQAFAASREKITVLDYGGGNGLLAKLLRQQGFDADTYDPFSSNGDKPICSYDDGLPANNRFDLITCFEVLEHALWPHQTISHMASLLKRREEDGEDGLILFSTLLQPKTIVEMGLNWWYAAPRNGHCSLYSAQALMKLFDAVGLKVASANESLHLAYRQMPGFAAHLRVGVPAAS